MKPKTKKPEDDVIGSTVVMIRGTIEGWKGQAVSAILGGQLSRTFTSFVSNIEEMHIVVENNMLEADLRSLRESLRSAVELINSEGLQDGALGDVVRGSLKTLVDMNLGEEETHED